MKRKQQQFFSAVCKEKWNIKNKNARNKLKQQIEQVAPLFSFILLPGSQKPLPAKCLGQVLPHSSTTKIDPQNLLEGPYKKKKSQRKNFLKLKLYIIYSLCEV